MKSNKEIKENLSTDEESIKRGLKDIKEGRTFNEVQIRAISELLKIKDKDIERLESKIKGNWCGVCDMGDIVKNRIEKLQQKINQLKPQLNSQTGKIKELIKHFDFLGSGGDNYAKYVVKRLKPLLGEKE